MTEQHIAAWSRADSRAMGAGRQRMTHGTRKI